MSSKLTPERLAEIERVARRAVSCASTAHIATADPSTVLSLCAALRGAWEEVERLRERDE